jgi:phospholipid/cholesterol/gamma-HCH transport system ATP-binding protein
VSATPFVACRGLSKRFAGRVILDRLTLEVVRGETLVILGGSGSGKSVLLKHMNGLLRPDGGEVWVDGEEIGRRSEEELAPVRRKIGMLFQGAALFDSLTVAENIAFPLREHTAMDEEAIAARTAEVLGEVDLPSIGVRYPAELSGGMRKRAGLARALALAPQGLLYDEPTTGLDPVVSGKINALIRRLQERLGLTSVVVTHDLQSAFFVADRLAFLADGVIRAIGTPAEIRNTSDPRLREFLAAAA